MPFRERAKLANLRRHGKPAALAARGPDRHIAPLLKPRLARRVFRGVAEQGKKPVPEGGDGAAVPPDHRAFGVHEQAAVIKVRRAGHRHLAIHDQGLGVGIDEIEAALFRERVAVLIRRPRTIAQKAEQANTL